MFISSVFFVLLFWFGSHTLIASLLMVLHYHFCRELAEVSFYSSLVDQVLCLLSMTEMHARCALVISLFRVLLLGFALQTGKLMDSDSCISYQKRKKTSIECAEL